MNFSLSYGVIVIAVIIVIMLARTATVVPQQSAFVVEYLGKYSRTLQAGFHILIPFVERIAYRHSLKENAIEIAEQVCITRDNVQVGVDGVLYMQVLDPHLASYGITNFGFAIAQLAQTTLRSEIGKIELDRTFEARGTINANVVAELDKASAPWGVKVLRYEIKNITPPRDVLQAMEKQMRAEREKRAVVLTSEGERDAKINSAEGDKQRVIKQSEANEAAADQRGRRPGAGDSRGRDRDRRGASPGRHRALRPRRHRGDAIADRRGIRQAVRQARAGRHDARGARESHRSCIDRHDGDQHREEAAGGAAGAGRGAIAAPRRFSPAAAAARRRDRRARRSAAAGRRLQKRACRRSPCRSGLRT